MSVIGIILSIVILGLLILVHEFGHFILARKNGIFVKEFSIGFGPRIVSHVAKSGTRFSWKAIPFGGSCAMLGEMEEEDDEHADDERSFEKKSVWARMSVILAGPFFNFFLAFVLSVIYIGTMGYDPPTVTSVTEGSAAYEAGLREGDLITSYNGKGVNFGREIYIENVLHPVSADSEDYVITFVRDGVKDTITIPPTPYSYYLLGIKYYADTNPAKIEGIEKDTPVDEAGMEDGDIITAINGIPISTGAELAEYFNKHELTGEQLTVSYTRRGGEFTTTVTPKMTTAYKLGFTFNMENQKTDALGTIKYSFCEMGYQISSVFKSLGYLISGRGSLDMLSGPVGIVEIVGQTYDASVSRGFLVTLMNLISLMISLSANLGIINLFPIPALDGGKFILLIIEAIRRKPIPRKYEGVATIIGATLLVLLMGVVLVNDILKLF
ncbi:MAG: RIP metalloprotease RseP [Lachnospiraceae bacterium]|nr:RIP metalloprotease RseP [Lachnospiraceae bacterium]